MEGMMRPRWFVTSGVCLLAGCMADGGGVEAASAATESLHEVPTLNTFITDCLEIDATGTGFGDANMVVGADIDGVVDESIELPACTAGDFIDWESLLGDIDNHRVFDLEVGGEDHTAFPRSNECVDEAGVLSKMDLTFGVVANNFEHVYLGLQRSATNGDAGYYWLFTRKPPTHELGAGPCDDDEGRLMYDISGPDVATGATGDVLVRGTFQGGGGTIFTVYQATAAANAEGFVTAVDAVNFLNPRWAVPAGLPPLVAAVNTTRTEAALGSDGVKTLDRLGGLPATGSFAEGAVPIEVFTGGAPCGASFFASVITRSSGSGGTSPDLKDLLGPFAVNFGALSAQATVDTDCDLSALFNVINVTGPDGSPVMTNDCDWTFDEDATSTVNDDCTDVDFLFDEAGAHTADVVVNALGCSVTIEDIPVSVFAAIAVDLERSSAGNMCPADPGADPDGFTTDAVTYTADVTGGQGPFTFSWSGVSCTGGSCTINPADNNFCAENTFSVTVTDARDCADTSEQETYTKITVVTASDNAAD